MPALSGFVTLITTGVVEDRELHGLVAWNRRRVVDDLGAPTGIGRERVEEAILGQHPFKP